MKMTRTTTNPNPNVCLETDTTFSSTEKQGGVLSCVIRRLLKQGGWTFIETLIVIAIVLILTGAVGFLAFRYIDSAKIVASQTQIESYSMALNSYFIDNQQFPTQEQGLLALWRKPSIEPIPKQWRGPYIDRAPQKDPWENEYEYKVPGPNGLPFGIISYGADGLEGGDGENADITSWGTDSFD